MVRLSQTRRRGEFHDPQPLLKSIYTQLRVNFSLEDCLASYGVRARLGEFQPPRLSADTQSSMASGLLAIHESPAYVLVVRFRDVDLNYLPLPRLVWLGLQPRMDCLVQYNPGLH